MEALQIWVRSLESKKDIRHRVLEARKEIGPLKWQKATEGITAAVTSHMRFREATDIYCYVDHQGEAGTRPVSYTHLDVYKRQLCIWKRNI